MNKTSFIRLKTRIQSGDPSAFEWLLEQCAEKCVASLVKNAGCAAEEAEEILMDALFHFRERVFQGKISHIPNIHRYMKSKCWGIWRDRIQESERLNPISSKLLRAFYDVSQTERDPMDWNEVERESESDYLRQMEATHRALTFLDEKDLRLLTLFYINKRKPKEIAAIMGLRGNEDVVHAKTEAFSRFMEQTEFYMAKENG
jgi:DNA-directed RNA polymerase specialized sigma24 family protein